jgi:mRNA-degrading endonuclease RelE of RelBE toxin-antitoxin system
MNDWLLTFKPSFHHQLAALDGREVKQVLKKLELLQTDPTPDAKVKKQLKYLDGKLHRLRAGPFRIFYTFARPYVSVLKLDKRDEGTYDGVPATEHLGGMEPPEVDEDAFAEPGLEPTHVHTFDLTTGAEPDDVALARPISRMLLTALRIPAALHGRLAAIRTEGELLGCSEVPPEHLGRVIDAVCGRALEDILRQPDLLAPTQEDDLLRLGEQDLASFLLRLSPDQERMVSWALDAGGPTLLKGGPGTGKSTVALYRVRAMIKVLRASGIVKPRVLFTTYTNALVRFSDHLLRALLGEDRQFVEVRTADAVVRELVPGDHRFANRQELLETLVAARKGVRATGTSLQRAAFLRTLERLSDEYLLEELIGVIEARGIATVEAYLEAPRPGRRVPLNAAQRQAVWALRAPFLDALKRSGLTTWTALRAAASHRVDKPRYDAVLVDEAQDLDPSTLRMLVGLASAPNRVFLTADANQSIYGGSFRWQDVHASLKFSGRTARLTANHRSTREIGVAASSFLQAHAAASEAAILDGSLDDQYLHTGPVPAVRAVASPAEELDVLSRFLRAAARELRVALHAAAVLCPTADGCAAIAAGLRERGIVATAFSSRDLDLAHAGVKVLTMKAAKGLEFPVVALGGALDPGWLPLRGGTEERAELLAQERRTSFVAMTRAMRALLVLVPIAPHPVLNRFDGDCWNLPPHPLPA